VIAVREAHNDNFSRRVQNNFVCYESAFEILDFSWLIYVVSLPSFKDINLVLSTTVITSNDGVLILM
jgi:hypothetical protein